jgi:hypothetical protein
MTLLRLLNVQGIAGLVAALALAGLLLVQKGETRQWRKQSNQFEQLYREGQASLAGTIANYRAAADAARSADRAAAERVRADQLAINERTQNDLETRLADARARAGRLRGSSQTAPGDPGRGGAAPMPALPAATGGAAQSARQDGLPSPMNHDDALMATEQAIQLDELIKWVRRQSAIDPKAAPIR